MSAVDFFALRVRLELLERCITEHGDALDRLETDRRAAASEVEAVRAERDHAREQLRACEV